jgi:hypothetical protein
MPDLPDLISTDACTLPTTERPLRLAEFDQLFQQSVRSVTSDGLRTTLRLVDEPGLRPRVQDLLDRESACCSFFDFALTEEDADLVLDVSVPPPRRDILHALTARARELSA